MENKSESKNSKIFQPVFFVLFVLFSIHFWELRYIPQKYNVENLLTWAVSIFAFIMVVHKKGLRFRPAIIIFVIGILFNILAAFINLGQSPYKTLLSFEFYYFILLYFLFHYLEVDRKLVENTVIVLAICYSVFFIIEYKNIFSLNIFNRDVGTAVDEKQLEIVGSGFLMLAYFLVLNRFFINRRIWYVLLAGGFFLVLIKCSFRTLVAGGAFVTAVMIFRMVRFRLRDFGILIFLALFAVAVSQHPSVQKVYKGLVTKTEGNIKEGEKYVRFVELEYFYKIYPQNFTYFIIGGGRPSGKNLYGYDPGQAPFNYNIVWVDIGILGFLVVIGGITLLGLLLYTFKAIFIRLPRDARYLNFYFFYLLIVSITNEEIYRNGIFTVHAVGLYLIDIILNEKKESENAVTEQEVKALPGTAKAVK